MSQNEWKGSLPRQGERRVEFETPLFSITRSPLRVEGGDHPHYSLELGLAAVMVLASTPEGQFVINREYRPSTEKVLLSCPGGSLDPGEKPIEGARRELREETGYTAEQFTVMGCSYPFPGIATQVIYYVRAHNASFEGAPNPDIGEFIQSFETELPALREKICSGAGVDGNLCTALFWLQQHERSI